LSFIFIGISPLMFCTRGRQRTGSPAYANREDPWSHTLFAAGA